jgi:hypothetical protein
MTLRAIYGPVIQVPVSNVYEARRTFLWYLSTFGVVPAETLGSSWFPGPTPWVLIRHRAFVRARSSMSYCGTHQVRVGLYSPGDVKGRQPRTGSAGIDFCRPLRLPVPLGWMCLIMEMVLLTHKVLRIPGWARARSPSLWGLHRGTKCAGLSARPPVLRTGPCGDRAWQPDFATPTETKSLVTEILLCIFLVTQSTTRLMSRRATVNDDIKGVRT